MFDSHVSHVHVLTSKSQISKMLLKVPQILKENHFLTIRNSIKRKYFFSRRFLSSKHAVVDPHQESSAKTFSNLSTFQKFWLKLNNYSKLELDTKIFTSRRNFYIQNSQSPHGKCYTKAMKRICMKSEGAACCKKINDQNDVILLSPIHSYFVCNRNNVFAVNYMLHREYSSLHLNIHRKYYSTGSNERITTLSETHSTPSPDELQTNIFSNNIPSKSFSDCEKLYKSPKNILHNAYDVVSKELSNRDLKLQPTYNIVKEKKNKHSWCCTYHLKWPEPMKFVSIGQTKQEASHKAALSVLLWLRQNKKITKNGEPLLVENSQMMREMMKKSIHNLNLDSHILDDLKRINEIYQNEFIPKLTENLDKNEISDETAQLGDLNEENNIHLGDFQQKRLYLNKYLAKEKVQLPISEYKQQFVDLLRENRVVIVKGEPGCGKSTRIPQYILESWAQEGLHEGEPCRIAVTQPRRIAAISLADRVANERDEQCGHLVGYQVRLKSKFNPVTGRILYCTTGILLRYLQSDLKLSNFTHVLLDEAHERDVNTDLLMNLLRNTQKINPNLKLIVMSATIDTDMFQKYFDDAPVLHIPGFTFPVESHFLEDLKELDLSKSRKMCAEDSPNVAHDDVVKVIEHIHRTKREGAILCFLPGWEDISKIERSIPKSNDMLVLCLHSRLNDSDQWKIFSRPPPGVRKVILSTNIAETSVTVDDVVYVIDTGIHKENRFDHEKGVLCIDNYWISQSSMIQRKGRAGRVQPGESFHLYTREKYARFPVFTDPEILRTSLTKIVLNSKVYSNNMDALELMNELPSPPEENATRRAVKELRDLDLLDENEHLTSLGKTLANFQLEPKFAKVLVNSVIYKCVTPVVDIITLFSAESELFVNSLSDKESVKRVKSQGSEHSDHLAMMRLFEAWLELLEQRGEETAKMYCFDANLAHHKLITMKKLRKIHFDYLFNGLHDALPISDDYSDNDELVKAVLFSGVGTLLKHRDWDVVKGRYKKKNVFLTNNNQKASITSESVNFKKTSFPSDLLIYFNELRSNIRRTTLVRECSVISPLAVLLFSPRDLVIKQVEEHDRLILALQDTKVEFLCTKDVALTIKKCRETLNMAYQYLIFQLTEGGVCNSDIHSIWNKILDNVNKILLKCAIK